MALNRTPIPPSSLPDYHFMLIAPNMDAAWLFGAARRYWARFRPTVIMSGELISYVPPEKTVAVTILARSDAARAMAVEVARYRNDALLDGVIYDTGEEARIALDSRAATNQPFGIPLGPATPIPPTLQPLPLTPGGLQIGQQLGSLGADAATATPTAPGNLTGFITQTPAPTFENPPLDTTPGAITGGS